VAGAERRESREHQHHDSEHQGATAAAEGGEEGRPGSDTDGVREQHQAELPDDLRQPEPLVVRREGESQEEHCGRAK